MKNCPFVILFTLLLLAVACILSPLPTQKILAIASTASESPPSAPLVSCVTPISDTTPTWTWNSGGGGNGVYRCRLDDEGWGAETQAKAFTPATALSEGRHVLQVQERDLAGNWSIAGEKLIDCASGLTMYVSPLGKDTAPGTLAAPVATVARARDLIRAIKAANTLTQPVTVFLRGGSYPLTETLILKPQDSGTAEAPIRYQAYLDERPVISGGAAINGPWQAYTANIMVTHVGTRRFNSLFVDGERAVRAREPDENESFPYYQIVLRDQCLINETYTWPVECIDRFQFQPGEVSASWQHLVDIEIVSFARWMQSRYQFTSVDDYNQLAFVKRMNNGEGLSFGWDFEGTDRYFVENFLEGVDTPGEWYLDRTSGDLYYWPLPERPIAESEFIAPVVGQLLQLGDVPAIEALIKGGYGEYADPVAGFEESDFSLSVWLNFPTGTVNPAWSMSKGDVYFTSGWGVANWSDGEDPIQGVQFYINDGSGALYLEAGGQPRGQWGHYVWTVDRGNKVISAYKDGVITGTLDLPANFGNIGAAFPLKIGSYVGSISYAGAMDELRLFDRVLAPAEVATLFTENSYSGAPQFWNTPLTTTS